MSEYMITTHYNVHIEHRGNSTTMQTNANEPVTWDGDPMQLVQLVRKIWKDNTKTNLDIYIRNQRKFEVWNCDTETETKYWLTVNQKTRRSKDVYIRLVEGDYYNPQENKMILEDVKIPLEDATMILAAA